jgi:hypothetical protein
VKRRPLPGRTAGPRVRARPQTSVADAGNATVTARPPSGRAWISSVAAGAGATVAYAQAKHWAAVIPPLAWAGGLGAAVLIGASAGLVPALRAARMSPTEALWSV